MGAKKLKYYGEVEGQIVKVLEVFRSNYGGESKSKIRLVSGGPTTVVDSKHVKILDNQETPEVLYGKDKKRAV